MKPVTNGTIFFGGEGLFFLGLSLGILGSTVQENSRRTAWILFTIGALSLLIAALIETYRRRKLPIATTTRSGALRPLSLTRAFDSVLQSPKSGLLFSGESFHSEVLMAVHPLRVNVPADRTLILQHFAGLGARVEVDLQSSELQSGDVVRFPASSELRILSVVALDADMQLSDSERAPQILAHFINEKEPR